MPTSTYVYETYIIAPKTGPVSPVQVIKDISVALNIGFKRAIDIYDRVGGELYSELTPEQLEQLQLKYTVVGNRGYEQYAPFDEQPDVVAAREWWATLTEEQKKYAGIMTTAVCCG